MVIVYTLCAIGSFTCLVAIPYQRGKKRKARYERVKKHRSIVKQMLANLTPT